MARRGTFPLALLAALAALTCVAGQGRPVVDDGAQTPPTQSSFTPKDSFLIDCGSAEAVNTSDGKSYKTDAQANHLLAAKDAFRVADDKADVPSPVYRTARVFKEEAVYSFPLAVPGWHFIRLYFFPLKGGPDVGVDLASATFSVVTDANVLLHSFTADAKPAMKEFLVNATENHLALKFQPLKGSAAFINAIEVVNAPDELVTDNALSVAPTLGPVSGLAESAYQVVYRVNVGGPAIGAGNDTLGRAWETDAAYVQDKNAVKDVSVPTSTVKYPDGSSRLVAPTLVYASAAHMADAETKSPNFNLTWRMDVDASFGYLVRLFFADIVSDSLNDLYFNVYVNGRKAISGLDLSTVTGDLAGAFYKDFVVNASASADKLTVQVAPMGQDTGRVDALLNGIEVLKMSNAVNSLDGEFGVDGKKADDGTGSRKAVVAVGFAMMFGAFAGLGAMVVKWYKRPQDWERRNSFSSWLLPIHTGQSFTKGSGYGSHRSGNTFSSTMGLGRFFSFAEIQAATKNFDENAVIGVGGFGNVYIGEIDDGVKVAVKRGSAESEQGINEFNTEIQMLSKLRHRHLVSLIGYCDENSEMILVYEYMHNGVFRDHIYGGKPDAPPLSWKQRLEICIGAARGLHYLHTGTAQGIIHRDVKTTNILLDENFVAKVSDFGLSKDGPGMNQLHVSTAVKGSFGYLDPEYFRCQQLTDKSDVYSFGVVLLEALCARPPIDPQLPREQVSLAEWGMQWKRKGLIEKIMDPKLAGTVNQESLNKFAETAEKCLAEFGSDRISMGDVLWNLEYALQMQDANPPEGAPKDGDEHDSSADGSSVNTISTEGSSSVVTSVPDTSTTAAGELFQQLADMKGR